MLCRDDGLMHHVGAHDAVMVCNSVVISPPRLPLILVVACMFPTNLIWEGVGVQAGDELTISYIDLELPRSARREALKRHFNFDCVCTR